jgi:hypothetical protein
MSSEAQREATDCCPRCGGAFHCGMHDAAPCACTGIQLDAALLQRLRAQYSGCLCLSCLRALAQGEPLAAASRESPGRGSGAASHNDAAANTAKDDAP